MQFNDIFSEKGEAGGDLKNFSLFWSDAIEMCSEMGRDVTYAMLFRQYEVIASAKNPTFS